MYQSTGPTKTADLYQFFYLLSHNCSCTAIIHVPKRLTHKKHFAQYPSDLAQPVTLSLGPNSSLEIPDSHLHPNGFFLPIHSDPTISMTQHHFFLTQSNQSITSSGQTHPLFLILPQSLIYVQRLLHKQTHWLFLRLTDSHAFSHKMT